MDVKKPWALRGLVIALAVVVAVVAYVIANGADEDEEPATESDSGVARIVSEEELEEIAADAEQPVYWAGEMEGAQLEFAEDETGTLIRYLNEDDDVGAARAKRIAVGSYPLPNPRRALNLLAQTPGVTVTNVPGVGKVVISPEEQQNVFFVDPSNEVQIEVYAPSAKRAIGMVRSGEIQPLG